MTSWIFIIVILAIGGGFLYFRSKSGSSGWAGSVGAWFTDLFGPRGEERIRQLEQAKEEEDAKVAELEKVRDAKKALSETRAKKIGLQKEIASTNEKSVVESRKGTGRRQGA